MLLTLTIKSKVKYRIKLSGIKTVGKNTSILNAMGKMIQTIEQTEERKKKRSTDKTMNTFEVIWSERFFHENSIKVK